ncbi:nitroreductase family deazaflavin-dependent oxidoreductase [Pseudactinotalea sp. Z1739]|uniref:nitroreductase family deazaflavin-dependent oxidoreductase n=1 Tax=Pseudactinotalea sp. Z1739 TaxID=3413028 RepID=UPI003C7CE00B
MVPATRDTSRVGSGDEPLRHPRRLPRRLARAPIGVFRLGLGGVFAGRLLMLDHRGRRSGRIRSVVLETVAREGRAHVVVSGYGWSAQWLRNIAADPRVRLWSGWGSGRRARAEILSPAQGLAVLEDYRRAHPRAARLLSRALNLGPLMPDQPLPAGAAARLPVVRITPLQRMRSRRRRP